MSLPSILEVSDFTARTVRRFTISVLAAYVATILSVIAIHNENGTFGDFFPYIMTCVFAYAFALAVDVFMESKKVGGIGRFISRVLVLGVIGAAYYFVFSKLKEQLPIDGLKAFLIFMAAAVLAFFAPFFCRGKANAFWQYSIALIVRFFQAFVYFGILFLGIVLLLQSLNYLFQLDMSGKQFAYAWFIITGIFASVFFLAGVPANFKSLDQTTAYPKFLRVLTEYFLVPLVSLYLFVLYAYSAKILFTWSWPLGGVASWIMGFSAVGVLTYFFIYSIKEKFLNYVEFYKKWFFVSLLPLLLVLGLSIEIRIQNYGVTKDRYFVVAFGVWALIMAVFYLISRSKNLKFMATSLFVVLLLTLYGPQSVFDLSRTSQMGRLEKILVQDGILLDGKVIKIDASKITVDDQYAINSIMEYVAQDYGVEVFQPWFNQDVNNVTNVTNQPTYPGDYWSKVVTMEGYMGIDVNKLPGPYGGFDASSYKSFYVNQLDCQTPVTAAYPLTCGTDVSGYKYYFAVDLSGQPGYESPHFRAGDQEYVAVIANGQVVTFKDVKTGATLATIDLKAFMDNLSKKYRMDQGIPVADMTISFDRGFLKISNLNAMYDAGNFQRLDFLAGTLLLK